jgi:hypothetical protein
VTAAQAAQAEAAQAARAEDAQDGDAQAGQDGGGGQADFRLYLDIDATLIDCQATTATDAAGRLRRSRRVSGRIR